MRAGAVKEGDAAPTAAAVAAGAEDEEASPFRTASDGFPRTRSGGRGREVGARDGNGNGNGNGDACAWLGSLRYIYRTKRFVSNLQTAAHWQTLVDN